MEILGFHSPWHWIGFLCVVLTLLFLDLGIFHRKTHTVKWREALVWSIVWISLSLIFNGVIYWAWGAQSALEFFTGYLIEKSLSVDNIFVMMVIFHTFHLPSHLQHRVLFWGIFGAFVMRLIFILAGAALVLQFHWILHIFGLILIVSSIKLIKDRNKVPEPEKNLIVRAFQRYFPLVREYHDKKFTIKKDGRRYATMLFLVLLTIEATDILFAVDSVPAIFAVTKDPFIIFTSNVFAILGLRSLYFLIADFIERLKYLKIGLALVLFFVGVKILLEGFYDISIAISLAVIALVLLGSILASWWAQEN